MEQACNTHGYFASPFPKAQLQEKAGFIVFDDRFLRIIGTSPAIEIIAEDSNEPFAHEACVYDPATGDVFITSNHIRRAGEKHVQISRVTRVNEAITNEEHKSRYRLELVDPQPDIVLANGGVNYKNGILFCEQGSLTQIGGLTFMSIKSNPSVTTATSRKIYSAKPLLTNYHGRWFNSVNDVVVHKDGSIWFTDPAYGYEQGIRPIPQLPAQTYRFDPLNGDVRAVESTLLKPNGLCFSPDQKTIYITDTVAVRGDPRCPGVYSPAEPASIYAFDVVLKEGGHFLINKRLFAFADQGIPDGIKCDMEGNVYSGCGDGVHVWSAGGMLIGKIYVPGGCANFCFGEKGEVFICNEVKLWRAKLATAVKGDLLGI